MYPKSGLRILPLEPNDTQGDDSDVRSTHSTPTCSTEREGEKGDVRVVGETLVAPRAPFLR